MVHKLLGAESQDMLVNHNLWTERRAKMELDWAPPAYKHAAALLLG